MCQTTGSQLAVKSILDDATLPFAVYRLSLTTLFKQSVIACTIFGIVSPCCCWYVASGHCATPSPTSIPPLISPAGMQQR